MVPGKGWHRLGIRAAGPRHRAVATRYGKLAVRYEATVLSAAIDDWLWPFHLAWAGCWMPRAAAGCPRKIPDADADAERVSVKLVSPITVRELVSTS